MFLDRRLYLPEEWAACRVRRREAPVPEEVRFATKPQQVMAMLVPGWRARRADAMGDRR